MATAAVRREHRPQSPASGCAQSLFGRLSFHWQRRPEAADDLQILFALEHSHQVLSHQPGAVAQGVGRASRDVRRDGDVVELQQGMLGLERLVFTPRNIEGGIETVRKMGGLQRVGMEFGEEAQGRRGDVVPAHEFWQMYDAGKFN
jgi:hypothetical protein